MSRGFLISDFLIAKWPTSVRLSSVQLRSTAKDDHPLRGHLQLYLGPVLVGVYDITHDGVQPRALLNVAHDTFVDRVTFSFYTFENMSLGITEIAFFGDLLPKVITLA